MNIITRPHSRHAMRFVDPAKKKAIQYATDKRREEQGKTVIHLHERPPVFKVWPSHEYMQDQILAFWTEHQALPTRILVPFDTSAPTMGWPVKGLPKDPEWDMRDNRGRFVEMDVIRDPDALQVTLA